MIAKGREHSPVLANVLGIHQRVEIFLKHAPALGDNLRLQRVEQAGLGELGQARMLAPNLGILMQIL